MSVHIALYLVCFECAAARGFSSITLRTNAHLYKGKYTGVSCKPTFINLDLFSRVITFFALRAHAGSSQPSNGGSLSLRNLHSDSRHESSDLGSLRIREIDRNVCGYCWSQSSAFIPSLINIVKRKEKYKNIEKV